MTEELTRKVQESRKIVCAALNRFSRPAIMCSFGKDSMAVLHLVMKETTLPVVFHREPFEPHKYDYANRIISLWGLHVYDFPPARTEVQEKGDELEVMNYYTIGAETCALPTGIRPPLQYLRAKICGLRDLYGKPTGTFAYPWDAVFHGHKSSDVDPILGAVPINADYALNVNSASAVFPLRKWTDADVWEYLEANHVPLHTDRYEKIDGRWSEKADKTHNPDYITACTACMRSTGPKSVPCPMLEGQYVQNVSSQLRRVKLPDLAYLQP